MAVVVFAKAVCNTSSVTPHYNDLILAFNGGATLSPNGEGSFISLCPAIHSLIAAMLPTEGRLIRFA